MKAASDVKLSLLTQGLLALIGKKAPSNHNHDGVYSNGARRVYNESWTGPQDLIRVEDKDVKWYLVLIGSSDAEADTAGATICIDWQMIPDQGDRVDLFYRMGNKLGTSVEDGRVHVFRNEDGSVDFQMGSANTAHYIKRICGYI